MNGKCAMVVLSKVEKEKKTNDRNENEADAQPDIDQNKVNPNNADQTTKPSKPTDPPSTVPAVVKRPLEPDPNPGKTPLERLLWKINLSRYYDALSKAGYDKKDLKKLEDLAKNEAKFEDVCKKAGLKLGHIRKLHHAVLDPSYP
eukprot:CAMPEP_0197517354 /NCGR_PEP_ID=MMETSP1318-20131121/2331_1 /TAXON_ID=552666 /ORGANISM="Partenskyella glossopodia, Strain RCC365" /LENGTH=144 /DNA_ID=CAMNT_0043066823 /DNA_START=33 /DNA_END=468 /DNA_ORIENTATION=+